ncbi:MAG: hypothetical protein Q4C30_04990, partial [Bacteroidia bacterium]|nr:hypothetical protein [Bacteroidia bacterium]
MQDKRGRRLVFNPTAEEAIRQNNGNYMPNKGLVMFERDVAALMSYLDTDIDDRSEEYVVWSESPTIDRQLFHLDGKWSQEKRLFHSRLTSVKVEKALSNMELPEWLRVEYLPLVLASDADYNTEYKVCKSLWSSSGRGVIIDPKGENDAQRRRFLMDHIKNDGYAIQEMFLDRRVELAFLFYVHKDGRVSYLGTNYYGSASNGAFGVEYLGVAPMQDYEGDIGKDWEDVASGALAEAIRQTIAGEKYHGYVGIDSMLYVDDRGKIRLRACVEVNLRMTMGNVNLGIRKMFPQGVKAKWWIEVKRT